MDRWSIVLGLAALVSLGNAAWMLVAPEHWYLNLPAGVPDTGPLNVHFVRDIGCAFVVSGVALGWAALTTRPAVRVPCVALAALFAGAHGALHLFDLARGALGPEHWWLDLPGVFAPALLLGALALHFARQDAASESDGPLHRRTT